MPLVVLKSDQRVERIIDLHHEPRRTRRDGAAAERSDLACRLVVLKSDQRVERIIDLHHEPRT